MLNWTDDRWHLDGKPIHAGCGMEVCWPDGTWQRVRIESGNAGRKLFACFDYHGLDLSIRVDDSCQLRWPEPRLDYYDRMAATNRSRKAAV